MCFEERSNAEKALEELNGKTLSNTFSLQVITCYIEGLEKPISVYFHISRALRRQIVNETDLFLKNLKSTVTTNDLRDAFGVFGPINSCTVKSIIFKGMEHYMGFVDFQDKLDAQKALREWSASTVINNLFVEVKVPYINMKMTPEQRQAYRLATQNAQALKKTYNAHLILGESQFNQQPTVYPAFQPPYGQQRYYNQFWMNPHQPQFHPSQNPQNVAQQRPPTDYQQPGRNGVSGPRNPNVTYEKKRRQHFQQPNLPRNNPMSTTQPQRTNQMPNPGTKVNSQPTTGSTQTQQPSTQPITLDALKNRLSEFLKLETDKQRNILGELIYPKVLTHAGPTFAPKITGMLVDFDVLTVQDILEMLEDEAILLDRVKEAEELIKQENDQENEENKA